MKEPKIHESVFIAPNASVYGNVTIAEDCGIWFSTTIRSETMPIVIGERTNVQDNCVLHVNAANGLTIGRDVTIGHGAIVHGCTIDDNTLIGMGAIVLDGAKIGKNCIIGAGALVKERSVIPDNSLVVGLPARIVRTLGEETEKRNRSTAAIYVKEAREYAEYLKTHK